MAKTKIDVRNSIISTLKEQERTYAWLARQTGISYSTLYHCIEKKWFDLSADNLKRINIVLKTDFKL